MGFIKYKKYKIYDKSKDPKWVRKNELQGMSVDGLQLP